MLEIIRRMWSEDEGQDIAEYAVMLAVILVLVVGTIRLIGSNANNVFSKLPPVRYIIAVDSELEIRRIGRTLFAIASRIFDHDAIYFVYRAVSLPLGLPA